MESGEEEQVHVVEYVQMSSPSSVRRVKTISIQEIFDNVGGRITQNFRRLRTKNTKGLQKPQLQKILLNESSGTE